MTHSDDNEIGELNWEHIRTFLATARGGSLRAVRQAHGPSANTVRRHINALEEKLGAVLFLRNQTGVALTADGERLLQLAEAMEQKFQTIQREIEPNVDKLKGRIWISVTEGLGTAWVMPRAVELQQQYPDLSIRVDCQMDMANLSQSEADLCIQLDPPQDQDLLMIKIGTLHLLPYASTEYLERNGRPKSKFDLRRHKYVVQDAQQMHTRRYLKMFTSFLLRRNIAIIANTSTAHYWAIQNGAGVGLLPTYASLLSDNVEPLDIGIRLRRDIWLSYHPDVKKLARIAMAIEWIKHIFDSDECPWFSEEFVHPYDLMQSKTAPSEVQMKFGRMGI